MDIIYKIGESADKLDKHHAPVRAMRQVRKLQRETGKEFKAEVVGTFPGKRAAREAETKLIKATRQKEGPGALPGNKGDH